MPKADGGEEPLPEGIFWLLMTGEIPTKQQVRLMNFYWLLDCNFPKGNTVVLRLGHWSQDEGGSSSCVVVLYFWGRLLTFTVHLFTQEYKVDSCPVDTLLLQTPCHCGEEPASLAKCLKK